MSWHDGADAGDACEEDVFGREVSAYKEITGAM